MGARGGADVTARDAVTATVNRRYTLCHTSDVLRSVASSLEALAATPSTMQSDEEKANAPQEARFEEAAN